MSTVPLDSINNEGWVYFDLSLFVKGAQVHHASFGNGTVIEASYQPDGTPFVRIAFVDDEEQTPYREVIASTSFLTFGWDEDEVGKHVSKAARMLKQELFGSDLTADDVSYILGLDRATILRYLREGRVVGYQVGREWRIPVENIKAYKAQMMAEKQREAERLVKTAVVEERRLLLQQSYPTKAWWASVCISCQEPLLMEWGGSAYYAECPRCSHDNLYEPPEQPSASGDTASSDSSEFDNIPF